MTDRRFFPVHDLAFRGAGARTSKIEAETLELMAQAAARERARTPPHSAGSHGVRDRLGALFLRRPARRELRDHSRQLPG